MMLMMRMMMMITIPIFTAETAVAEWRVGWREETTITTITTTTTIEQGENSRDETDRRKKISSWTASRIVGLAEADKQAGKQRTTDV